MAATLTSLSELQNFKDYQVFMRERLRQVSDASVPIHVSKEKIDFSIAGKEWKGYAVFIGIKSELTVKALRKEGLLFREGTCRLEGRGIFVDGLDSRTSKGAQTTLKKLKLGYTIVGAEEEEEPSTATTSVDLLRKRLKSLVEQLRRWPSGLTKETDPFVKQAAKRAAEAEKLLTSDPARAAVLLAEGEEFMSQAVVGALEGGDPTAAVQVETRRQELVEEVADVARLRDPANDPMLAQAKKALDAVLVAVGKKDTEKAEQLLDAVESLLSQVSDGPDLAPDVEPDISGFEDWNTYRTFLKAQLKRIPKTGGPLFVSRKKIEFSIEGKPFKGHAILFGPKARATSLILKREGHQFMEGECRLSGKALLVSAIKVAFFKGAAKTMVKLRLGRKLMADGELLPDEDEAAEDATEDPTGKRAIDKQVKEIAENLVKLRDAVDVQKKAVPAIEKGATAMRKAADGATKAARAAAAAGTDDADLWDAAASADSDARNAEAAAKSAATSAKRAVDSLRELTERLHRIKDSPETSARKTAELKKLKSEVAAGLLDAKMANLDPADPKTGAILSKQIEARFGVKLKLYESKHDGVDADGRQKFKDKKTDPKKEAEALKELYLTLSKAPAFPSSHLKRVVVSLRPDTAASEGGVYYGGSKKVEITCKRPKTSLNYGNQLAGRSFFPDGVDPDAAPKDNEPVSYFSWATLHEVAHAVDAKHKFMDSKGSQAKYGGWTEFGGDVAPIGQAVAAHFGSALSGPDRTQLAKYAVDLMKNKKTAPSTPEETAVQDWVASVRVGKGLWWDGSSSKSLAIGGKVYQEAYANWWVAYDLAARSKGIHGYQFRAPGEWFAELYAAYYSDKLKPSHPFVPDLAKLETPK